MVKNRGTSVITYKIISRQYESGKFGIKIATLTSLWSIEKRSRQRSNC